MEVWFEEFECTLAQPAAMAEPKIHHWKERGGGGGIKNNIIIKFFYHYIYFIHIMYSLSYMLYKIFINSIKN